MRKRFSVLTLVLFLLVSAVPAALSQSECDFSFSNYARAVQLHDMGDYARALRHYDCARQDDPDNAIIPILIENLHEDSANAASAWSRAETTAKEPICAPALDHLLQGEKAFGQGDSNQALIHPQCVLLRNPNRAAALNLMGEIYINRGDSHAAKHYYDRADAARNLDSSAERSDGPAPSQKFEMPEWLTPFETAPSSREPAPAQPIVVFTEHSRLLLQTEQMLIIADDNSLTTWQRRQALVVEKITIVISTGEMTLTLYQQRLFAMSREARITLRAVDRGPDARDQAQQAFKAGDLEGAIEWMLKVTDGAGATVDDYDFLASLYSMHGDMEAVESSLMKAIELAPTRSDLRCRLGTAHVAQGDTAAAYAQFDWILSVEKSNLCAIENRRALNRSLNVAAPTMPVRAAKASPAQATFELGMAMLSNRKLFAAANTLIEALVIDPAHAEARCQLGVIMTDWANYGSALAHFDRILADEPQNECARQNRRIAILNMLGMYVPLTVDDFFYHARIFAQVEEWELARDAFRHGLSLDPTRTDVSCELGMIYAQLGDERAALYEFDRVLAQDSVDSCAWPNRDALLQRLRDEG